MYSFLNDYNEIAHPFVLDSIVKNNYVQTYGYGEDEFCLEAKQIIKNVFECPKSEVYFMMAGTQTNLTIIDHMLKTYEGVIATDTSHINQHEVSSIEACGKKILTVPNQDGKLTPTQIENLYKIYYADTHMTLPKAVYISNSTELGTIYSLSELIAISQMCKKYDLYLFMDGARLGSALTSPYNDISPRDLAKYCDAFYIGGTKNGGIMGEALVINNDALTPHFMRQVKCRGSLYAKSKVIGMSFTALFTDKLYFDLAKKANDLAQKIFNDLKYSYEFYKSVESNQIFMLLPNNIVEKLSKEFVFEKSFAHDENTTCIRLVTSWATDERQVDNLIEFLLKIKN